MVKCLFSQQLALLQPCLVFFIACVHGDAPTSNPVWFDWLLDEAKGQKPEHISGRTESRREAEQTRWPWELTRAVEAAGGTWDDGAGDIIQADESVWEPCDLTHVHLELLYSVQDSSRHK